MTGTAEPAVRVCCSAVQRERGPRKNKGRHRLRLTSRRSDVITGGSLVERVLRHLQQPTTATVLPSSSSSRSSAAVRRAGAGDVSRGETDRRCSAFMAVGRAARNAVTDLVANNNSCSNNVTSSQSTPALDMLSQCKRRFV